MAKKFLKTDLVPLIYGWRKKLRLTSHAIYVRDWLTYEETVSLSEYAGYDLTEI